MRGWLLEISHREQQDASASRQHCETSTFRGRELTSRLRPSFVIVQRTSPAANGCQLAIPAIGRAVGLGIETLAVGSLGAAKTTSSRSALLHSEAPPRSFHALQSASCR